MKKLLGALALIVSLASPAYAEEREAKEIFREQIERHYSELIKNERNKIPWGIREMNEEIEQTNFIVGRGCSGTLISAEHNLILTNHHCITNLLKKVKKEVIDDEGVISEVEVLEKEDLKISQKDYDKFDVVGEVSWVAELLDYDKDADLALVQTISDLPHEVQATIFSGDMVYAGEEVFAVGNPRGLDNTVSKGIVSSTYRRVGDKDFIQIDAGLAPGSSGGSLYNEYGELIGVPAAGYMGSSLMFAMPYTSVQKILAENCFASLFMKDAPSYEACEEDNEKLPKEVCEERDWPKKLCVSKKKDKDEEED